jgi:hypothetical protein
VDAIATVRVRLPDDGVSRGIAVDAAIPWPRRR